MKLEYIIADSFTNSCVNRGTRPLHNDLKLERHFKLKSFNNIVTIPTCVFPQFRDEMFSRTTLDNTCVYDASLYSNSALAPKDLYPAESLYKYITSEILLRSYTSEFGYLTAFYGDSAEKVTTLVYNSSAGYLELAEENEVKPILITAFVCRLSLEHEKVRIYPLYPVVYINSQLLDHPKIKAFISKVIKACTKAYVNLDADDSYNNVSFSEFNPAIQLTFKELPALVLEDNTLTVNSDGTLNEECIKEFSEWICS